MSHKLGFAPLIGLVVLATAVLGGCKIGVDAGEATPSASASSPEAPDAALVQCRIDGVMEYMTSQGFSDGDYVVGEERLDRSLPYFEAAGPLAFGQGVVVDTRDRLAEAFDSDEPALAAMAQAQVTKLDGVAPAEEVLDASNWEVVQLLVPSTATGNSGFVDGTPVATGERSAEAGDAYWLFVDPSTCLVPRAVATSTGEPVDPATPETEKPVAAVRVGCINPTDGVHPTPPPTHEEPACPPDQVVNDNGVCVTPKSDEPIDYRQPGDSGAGADVGNGARPPSTVDGPAQPPAEVETEVTNPETGVTDSSTSAPGSETGGQAVGTETGAGAGTGNGTGAGGPETYPSTPPPNEGGSNDGRVSDDG